MRTPLSILLAALLLSTAAAGCRDSARPTLRSEAAAPAEASAPEPVDISQRLSEISPAIPIYDAATYRDDLSRRDTVVMRSQYGPQAEVYTLASRNSFPAIWHYYVSYLAQYREFEPPKPFPPSNQRSRTIQVRLNQAMQDPFIPAEGLDPEGRQVVLQIAEQDEEGATIIRYIVLPPQPPAPVLASGDEPPVQIAGAALPERESAVE
jgi:hypothetical protein